MIRYLTDPNLTTLYVSIVALLISIIALIYTIRAFLLKSGQKIRCDYSTSSTIDCDDNYISSLTLENIKDRASVIFKIYLKYGYNTYLLIEDFSDSPLILKPFEVYHKEYDPIIFYSSGMNTVKLDRVFDNKRIKKTIILSTTNGKYKVKANTKGWDPIITYFKNFFTYIINPIRLPYKEKSYGSRIKFLLILKYNNGNEDIIPIHSQQYNYKLFAEFQLTPESLQSKEELELFIKQQQKEGNINFDTLEIIDFQKHYEDVRSRYGKEPQFVETYRWFKYYFIGRYSSIKWDRDLKKKNKMQNKATKHTEIKQIADLKVPEQKIDLDNIKNNLEG